MILLPFRFDVGPLEVNLYLMGDEASGEAALIDAGAFAEEVAEAASERGLRVSTILLTHLHHDHVDGLADYLERWDAAVVAPAALPAAPSARIVGEGDAVEAGPFRFDVLRTSGHTPESISYHCRAEGICFVGDALFAGAVGGTSDDERHAEQLDHVRRKILTLPPETQIYPGHGPASSVAIEATSNPFLQPGFTRLP